jgi:hypothetical protein
MKPLLNVKTIALLVIVMCHTITTFAQTIGTFGSIAPGGQPQTLMLPSTHTFQRIIKTGDALSLGGNLGDNLDFTGYVPIAGSSINGRLSISTESTPAQVAILDISYSTATHTWSVSAGGKVTFNPAVIGTVSRFCSGTVTPNNTIMVGEESTTSGDVNTDGYQDQGWLIEIDPATRTVINQDGSGGVDKLWATGRQSHENAVIKSDNSIMYWGADANPTGYLYKFVPTVAGNFSAGLLYVLDAPGLAGNGTWRLVANTTQAERNATVANSTSAGADNFNGIEDVEIGPDGKIYFAAKGEGKVYRFTDNGTFGTGTDISGLEVFVGNSSAGMTYDVDGPGPLGTQSWGLGNDNMAFDGEGNLWILNDGGGGHIWVVGPTHTQASPQVKLFARTPAGGEPTGISFSPDYRYMFLSFQHPTATGSQTDAAGVSVTFNTHTTVVIARSEHLGPFSTLPLSFTAFDARQVNNGVAINWSVTDVSNHNYFSVERSTNGIDFEEIHRNNENINGALHRSFNINDNNLPVSNIIYYRIRQCDMNGDCHYTDIKTIRLSVQSRIATIYPQPANDKLNVQYHSFNEGSVKIIITDINGKTVMQESRNMNAGVQSIVVNIGKLNSGMYLVSITDKEYQKSLQRFIKE